MRTLRDYIQVYDHVINEVTCNLIIEEFERKISESEDHDTELYKFHQLNLNQHMPDLAQAYVGSLYQIYEDYFKSLGVRDFVHLDKWEDIRIKKYQKGSKDRFGLHIDAANDATATRSAVAILYLNSNDGYTTFPQLGLAVKPEPGRVVVFPPTWMYPHTGETPTDNDKYIMMTCLHLG